MEQTSKFISGLKRGKDFNDSERHKIIQEYLSSDKTKKEIWQKHTGQPAEDGQLLTWMRLLGYENKPKQLKKPKPPTSSNDLIKHPSSFSTEEKCAIIEEYLATGFTKRDIWEKYTGQKEEHGSLLRWMRMLGYVGYNTIKSTNLAANNKYMANKKNPKVEKLQEDYETLQLKKRIAELESQLKDAEMKAIAFSTMVDIAEKEFNIAIRKKFNTKPLKK